MAGKHSTKQDNSAHQMDRILANLSQFLGGVSTVARRLGRIPLEQRQTIAPAKERADQLLEARWNNETGPLGWADVASIASTAQMTALTYWGSSAPKQGGQLLTDQQSNLAVHKEPLLACADRVLHEVEKCKAHCRVLEGEKHLYPPDSEPMVTAIRENYGPETSAWGQGLNEEFAQSIRSVATHQEKQQEKAKRSMKNRDIKVTSLTLENIDPVAMKVAVDGLARQHALPSYPIAEKLAGRPNLDTLSDPERKQELAREWASEVGAHETDIAKAVEWFATAMATPNFGADAGERRLELQHMMVATAAKHMPEMARAYESGLQPANAEMALPEYQELAQIHQSILAEQEAAHDAGQGAKLLRESAGASTDAIQTDAGQGPETGYSQGPS